MAAHAPVQHRVTTRSLVADYVLHRVQRKGLVWPASSPNTFAVPRGGLQEGSEVVEPTSVENTMRALGEEFEERYIQVSGDVGVIKLQ